MPPTFIIGRIVVGQIHSLCEQLLGPPGLSLHISISNELSAEELYPNEVKMEAFSCFFLVLFLSPKIFGMLGVNE